MGVQPTTRPRGAHVSRPTAVDRKGSVAEVGRARARRLAMGKGSGQPRGGGGSQARRGGGREEGWQLAA